MPKLTLYLPEDLMASVEWVADEKGVSKAEVIREALRTALVFRARSRPRVPLVETGLGDPSVARRTDELLDGFGR